MTDKATVTITAPKAGVVLETRGRGRRSSAVHAVLVVFELDGGAEPARPAPTGRLADHEAQEQPHRRRRGCPRLRGGRRWPLGEAGRDGLVHSATR